MKLFRLSSALLILSFTAACAPSWSTSSVDNKSGASRAAKSPSSVVITEGDLNKPYESLGDISVTVHKTTVFDDDPTRELVNKKLQEKAAEMGADAVILVRYGTVGIGLMSWGHLDGKGRAVAYK